MWAAVLVAGLCAVSRLQALLLARVTVPPFGLGGAAASLGCEYDPQGDAVYSVKWYKVSLAPGAGMLSAVVGAGRPGDLPLPALQQPRRGRVRPARGQHRHQPQQRHAPPPGTAQRGQHRQVLYCTVLYCTVLHCTLYCRYRCEVSTEAPMFSTESKYGDLLVIVLPSSPPQVPPDLIDIYISNISIYLFYLRKFCRVVWSCSVLVYEASWS